MPAYRRSAATTMPHGTAIAIVAIVSRNVVAVPSASASRCCHTTDQSNVIAAASDPILQVGECESRAAEMRDAPIETINAARDRVEQDEVDEHRERIHLDRLKAL